MKKNASPLITPAAPVLVLRICQPDGTSRNNFRWPTAGPVTCPDWKATAECGNGLHGWLRGEGDHSVADGTLFTTPDALWLAVLVPAYVELNGKVKFPAGEVVCSGDRLTVTEYLKANGCAGAIIGGTATAGDAGTATAGYAGTATAGYDGTATAGSRGTATAGDAGTATAGSRGTATAGYAGTATAGDAGAILIKRWNGKRYLFALGNIGEDTDATGNVLLPNIPYKLNDAGHFIPA
ncbi:hypothetical protein BEN47_16735 [Hymenobacter lapidarius]|uniref:Uncharacterized protein n=1 Tax=Hymenobacter lapidarius TaxID=1908237 RepID=A0A1G1SZR7_9BACT|nr:hypothetical protein [Hymenobacter lapidarius]OGX84123.1 hypothetical protein BEN47_16735 [Hymenobacter lapidarius]